MPRRKKLTSEEWSGVFQLRRRAKQGQVLSKEDFTLIEAAFREDPKKYDAMTGDVFDSTVPFGSNVRWRSS